MGSVTLSDPSLFREQCYIDGQWCDADDGGTFTVDNPATEEALGTAPRMGEAETRRAIDAAHAAFLRGETKLPQNGPACWKPGMT